MNDKNYRALTEFVAKYIIFNQTYLVDNILKDDSLMKHYNNLHNYYYFRERLSDGGQFIGGMDNLCRKREEIAAKIKVLKNAIGESNGAYSSVEQKKTAIKINCLESDIKALEEAAPIPKNALEWWLVPYWLAEELKERDEVVLRIYGCNWWGRSSVKKTLNRETVLFEIWEEARSSVS